MVGGALSFLTPASFSLCHVHVCSQREHWLYVVFLCVSVFCCHPVAILCYCTVSCIYLYKTILCTFIIYQVFGNLFFLLRDQALTLYLNKPLIKDIILPAKIVILLFQMEGNRL